MAFHDVLFPPAISYGSKGGPRFSTTVLTLASGKERRNQNWVDVRAEYDVSHGIKDDDDMMELREFFYARRGRAHSFRFFDHADHVIINQWIGDGDGTTKNFQLVKTYSPNSNPYTRLITKPIEGTISGVQVGGVDMTEHPWLDPDSEEYDEYWLGKDSEVIAVAFMVDYTTGIFHFPVAPADGDEIGVTYAEFHVHVRFDTDYFDAMHEFWRTETWESITLVEIKEGV